MTRTVFSERSSSNSEAKSLGFSLVFGSHHLRVSFRRAAKDIHEAMLASWSIFETIISEPSGNSSANERLRKSWVVAEPRTGIC